jgi:hypothetical protein
MSDLAIYHASSKTVARKTVLEDDPFKAPLGSSATDYTSGIHRLMIIDSWNLLV